MTIKPLSRRFLTATKEYRQLSHRARLWVVIGVPLMLQAFVFYYSINYGVLVGLVQWDDCAYLARGISNLDELMNAHNFYELGYSLTRGIRLHAPLSDLQTMAGLMISGGQVWGPFMLNVLAVALVFYAIAYRATSLNIAGFAALLILLVVQPVTINSMVYLKADWKGGLLIAAAIFLLSEAAERDDKRLKLMGAGLLGLAALSKLTAFYVPLLALGVFVTFELYGYVCRRIRAQDVGSRDVGFWQGMLGCIRSDWRTRAQCATLVVAPYCLFFALNANRNMKYIQQAISSNWHDGLTPFERAVYYSPVSVEGSAGWGTLHVAFLVFVGCCVAIAIRRRDYRYVVSPLLVALLALLFLAPLAAAPTSNFTFGSTMLGVVIAATLIAMCTFVRAAPRSGGLLALLFAVALAVPTRLPLSNSSYGAAVDKISNSELRDLKATYSEIAARLDVGSTASSKILIFFNDMYAPSHNLAILHFQQTGEVISSRNIDDYADYANVDAVERQLADARFALTMKVDTVRKSLLPVRGMDGSDPVAAISGADELLARRFDYKLIGAWPAADGEYRLYRNEATSARIFGGEGT